MLTEVETYVFDTGVNVKPKMMEKIPELQPPTVNPAETEFP
jgi:hypothetical protein